MILHEIFRVVSRFPRYISCYISRKVDFLWDSVMQLGRHSHYTDTLQSDSRRISSCVSRFFYFCHFFIPESTLIKTGQEQLFLFCFIMNPRQIFSRIYKKKRTINMLRVMRKFSKTRSVQNLVTLHLFVNSTYFATFVLHLITIKNSNISIFV